MRALPEGSAVQLLPWNSNKAGLEAVVDSVSSIGWIAGPDGSRAARLRFFADDANSRRKYKATFEMMLNSFVVRE